MPLTSDPEQYELCTITTLSPAYRLFDDYQTSEAMFTVAFFILLMYLEEFLFIFRKTANDERQSIDTAFVEYLLVRLGHARPVVIQTIVVATSSQPSPSSSTHSGRTRTMDEMSDSSRSNGMHPM